MAHRSPSVCLLALALVAGPAAGQTVPLFGAPHGYAASADLQNAIAADLDGDGRPDIVEGHGYVFGLDGVTVLMNEGGGVLGAPGYHPLSSIVDALAAADLDGDGAPEILAALSETEMLAVLPNEHSGSFGAAVEIPVQENPKGVGAGDFDEDGLVDVVVDSQQAKTVQRLPGLGGGALGTASSFAVPGLPRQLAVADLDDDGHLDVVTELNNAKVAVLLGLGDGQFATVTSTASGSGLSGPLVVADLDGDGVLDLALDNVFSDTASVVLGLGGGSFAAPMIHPVGDEPRCVASADFDADGHLDLAVVHTLSDDVLILRGLGSGTFAAGEPVLVGEGGLALVATDLDGDARPDLVVASPDPIEIAVLRNQNTELGPWHDLGASLAGAAGPPILLGNGTLAPHSPGSLELLDGKPAGRVFVFASFASTPVPFKGGTLVPFPYALLLNLTADMTGKLTLPFTWPEGVPAGTQVFFQELIKDPAAPQGAAFSNALVAVTP